MLPNSQIMFEELSGTQFQWKIYKGYDIATDLLVINN